MLIKDIKKMEAYTPTEYVNDSEPDLDADNLNKTERQLRDTVAKANEIIDTLKSLISNVSVNSEDTVPSSAVAYKMEQDIEQLNSNISGISNNLDDIQKALNPIKSTVIDNADTNIINSVNLVVWGPESYSTPYKTGNTVYGNGFCITYSTGDQWFCQLAMAVGDSNLFTRHRRLGVWSGWTTIGTASK